MNEYLIAGAFPVCVAIALTLRRHFVQAALRPRGDFEPVDAIAHSIGLAVLFLALLGAFSQAQEWLVQIPGVVAPNIVGGSYIEDKITSWMLWTQIVVGCTVFFVRFLVLHRPHADWETRLRNPSNVNPETAYELFSIDQFGFRDMRGSDAGLWVQGPRPKTGSYEVVHAFTLAFFQAAIMALICSALVGAIRAMLER